MEEPEEIMQDYRLTTAEILYKMPDYPNLLQSYLWQSLDRVPDFFLPGAARRGIPCAAVWSLVRRTGTRRVCRLARIRRTIFSTHRRSIFPKTGSSW